MNHLTPEPIYLLVTDLAAVKARAQKWNIPSVTGASTKISLYHFAPLKHWAIQVRDRCYEVNSKPSVANPKKPDYVLNDDISLADWQHRVDEKGLAMERVEVGATTYSDAEIRANANLIWNDRFIKKYRLDKQNCQNFGYLLYKRIAMDPDKIKTDMRQSWKRMPRRFSDITNFIKSSVAPGIARAILVEAVTDGIILGAEVLGVEGVIGLEVLGLEVAGVALLGPIGEVIFAATIIALILRKSQDKKWLKKLTRGNKKDQLALERGDVADQSESVLVEQAGLIMNEISDEAKSNVEKDSISDAQRADLDAPTKITVATKTDEQTEPDVLYLLEPDPAPPSYEWTMSTTEPPAPPLPPRPVPTTKIKRKPCPVDLSHVRSLPET